MTAAFDTLAVARDLEQAGMDRAQAEVVAILVRSGQDELATRADMATFLKDLATRESRITGTLYRTLWLQGAGIIAAIAAPAGIAIGLVRVMGPP